MKRAAFSLAFAVLACSSGEKSFDDLKELWCQPYAGVYCKIAADCGCGRLEGFEQDCVLRAQTACAERIDNLKARPEITDYRVQAGAITDCLELLEKYGSACVLPPAELFDVQCPLIVHRAGLFEPCGEGLCNGGRGICLGGLCSDLPQQGQDCALGRCAPGLSCFADRRCQKPLDPGSGCAADAECAAGFLCLEGTCARPEYSGAFGECLGAEQCPEGTLCLTASARVCTDPPTEGQSCPAGVCQKGFFCSGTDRVCRALPPQGAACAEDIYCAEDSGCDPADSICKARPGEGAECLLGENGPVLCAPGLVCVQQRCAQPPGEGEICGLSENGLPVCSGDLGCSFEDNGDNICKPKVAEGQNCTNDGNCLNGNFCDFEKLVCRKKLSQGQACQYGNECAEGLACQPAGAQNTCQPLPGRGEVCTSECASGLVCSLAGPGRCAPPWCAAW